MNVDVTEYDTVADGETPNTTAIQAAIDAVADSGGGTLRFPPGEYVTGTLDIKSGTTIRLDPSATLLGSTDPDEYGIDEFTAELQDAGSDAGWHDSPAPLIVAEEATDIAIRGGGTIDARGHNF